VFWSGLGVTAVLAAVTAWSGADAIAAKNGLKNPSTTGAEDAVLADARRTDGLLIGAGVAGLATAVIGIWFTDWHPAGDAGKPTARAAVVPLPGGAALSAAFAF
jgi:hypothetical protein